MCSGTGNISSSENVLLQDKSFLYEIKDKIEQHRHRPEGGKMKRRLDVTVVIIST
jgi:hypothetical protein